MVRPALVSPVTKPRRDTPFDRYLMTRSLIGLSLGIFAVVFLSIAVARSFGGRVRSRARSEIGAEIGGHRLDLVRGPERAAADHAIKRRLPGAGILPLVLPHRVGVALEAFRCEDFAPLLRRLLRLRRRGHSEHRPACQYQQGPAQTRHFLNLLIARVPHHYAI